MRKNQPDWGWVGIWRKSIQAAGPACSKVLKQDQAWHVRGRVSGLVCLEQSEQGREWRRADEETEALRCNNRPSECPCARTALWFVAEGRLLWYFVPCVHWSFCSEVLEP